MRRHARLAFEAGDTLMTPSKQLRPGVAGPDRLCSAVSGLFPLDRVNSVPSYFDDNLVAHRHWIPPAA